MSDEKQPESLTLRRDRIIAQASLREHAEADGWANEAHRAARYEGIAAHYRYHEDNHRKQAIALGGLLGAM